MCIIEIPNNLNKLLFIANLLNNLIKEFNNYTFINCTVSPIKGYSYLEHQGKCYRTINDLIYKLPDTDEYVGSYKKERLYNQGISLNEYIEMITVFELDQILIGLKTTGTLANLSTLVNISICPDGLNEIHIDGESALFFDMINYLKKIEFRVFTK